MQLLMGNWRRIIPVKASEKNQSEEVGEFAWLKSSVFSEMGRGSSLKTGFGEGQRYLNTQWREFIVTNHISSNVKKCVFPMPVHLAACKEIREAFLVQLKSNVCAHHKGCPDLQLFSSPGNPAV